MEILQADLMRKIILLLLISLCIGVVLASNTFDTLFNFKGTVEIPKIVDSGEKPIGEDFALFKINLTGFGNNSWVTLGFKNYTGPLPNTSFKVKNSAGEVIFKKWYPDEVLNFSGQEPDVYTIYANGNTGGETRFFVESRCNYCQLIKKDFPEITSGEE